MVSSQIIMFKTKKKATIYEKHIQRVKLHLKTEGVDYSNLVPQLSMPQCHHARDMIVRYFRNKLQYITYGVYGNMSSLALYRERNKNYLVICYETSSCSSITIKRLDWSHISYIFLSDDTHSLYVQNEISSNNKDGFLNQIFKLCCPSKT